MARLGLTLLGGFQARPDPGGAVTVPTRKAQALLAFLALPPGHAHPRDKLAALLWGGSREASARASLRQTLFSIRKALGGTAVALRLDGDAVALDPALVEVDAVAFEHATGLGTPEALARAAQLYRGDLLAGLAVAEAPFEEWLLAERERLRELALEALAKLLASQRQMDGAPDAAIQTALRLVALDPLQEAVHRTLMRLYARVGRRGAALRQYQHCVTVLQRELGVEPEAETKALYQEILRQRSRGAPAGAAAERREPSEAAAQRAPGVGGDAELVGRAREMAQLYAALAAAAAGAGRVVAVLGEAGIGKSRLVVELAAEAERRGLAVLLGRSYESEQILPFGPWVDALRTGRIAEDARLLDRLGPAWRAELARLVPEVAEGPPAASATSDNRQLFESVVQLLAHLARQRPLVVVLEDLHWADEMSARLLAFVGRRLAACPVLAVLTAREDELGDAPALRHALGDLRREGRLTTLGLEPLARGDTQALVRALARSGDEAAVGRLSEHAWAVSEGNPFVVVETVRAHAEGAAPAPGRGLGLPERVREMVGRRLERLSEPAQALAAVAAVIGREFEFALLQRAAGLGEEQTAGGVEELVRRRVLHGLGERFDFTHDRVREVASGRILAPRRKLIHRRVAEAIEALYAADLGSHALALGLHYRDAEVWERGARHLYDAGFAARERAANREAVACFDAALGCLRSLPADRERTAVVIDTILQQETALMGLGEFRRSLDGLREAEALARGLGDRRRLGRVFGRFAYHLASLGDLGRARENAEQARAIAIELGDARSRLSSNVVLARALYACGDYRRAMEAVRENDALARAAPPTGRAEGRSQRHAAPELPAALANRHNLSFSRIWGVLALAELGEFDEAIRRGEEALRLSAQELGRHGDVWAHLGVGRLYLVKGDLPRAIEVLERGLPLCEAGGDLAVYFSRTASSLGGAYALAGRLDEALALLERAAGQAESIGFAYSQALVLAILGEARLLAGDADEAARRAREARDLARRHGQLGWEAWALRLLGEVAARRDSLDPAGAEAHFCEAAARAAERGMRPLQAHCRLGLGAVHRRAGAAGPARREIAAALAEYRALAMPYWRDRAGAELAQVR